MHGDRFTIDDNDDIIPYDDDADDDKPIKIQAAQKKWMQSLPDEPLLVLS